MESEATIFREATSSMSNDFSTAFANEIQIGAVGDYLLQLNSNY